MIRELQYSDGKPLKPETLHAQMSHIEPKPVGVLNHIATAEAGKVSALSSLITSPYSLLLIFYSLNHSFPILNP